MNELVTTDTILNWLKEQVEHKRPLSAGTWLEAALKLNVLIGDEHDKLYQLESDVAKQRVEFIENGDSVAKADARVEATDLYRQARRQKARIGQIEEFIRISKKQSTLKDTEYGNY